MVRNHENRWIVIIDYDINRILALQHGWMHACVLVTCKLTVHRELIAVQLARHSTTQVQHM